MLEQVKLLLGLSDNSKDKLLTLLIDQAINEAKNYTHNDDYSSYSHIIAGMVIWKYNRLGSEALSSESYSGVNFNYENDYPEPIIRLLQACRKIVML